ncbi:MAG: hypothetical protein NC253_05380 [Ruminococcus sp.]|nr:hypothetical protein [Ruminococcus sp.]MCM1381803.1 hypothetical protein [Muribaculaceae bacterium]MCM1478261.1 hypothetical protein [Muribaculaceae bacterium]
MRYSKEITVRQIMFKYRISRKQAEIMYSEFERSNDTDVLEHVVFKPDGVFDREPAALSY